MNDFELKKQQLITQGFAYRNGVKTASAQVKKAMHPDALSHGFVGMVARTALTYLGRGKPGKASAFGASPFGALSGLLNMVKGGKSNFSLKAALPLALSAFSLLRRVRMSKGMLGGLAAAGLAAGAATYFLKKRAAHAETEWEQDPLAGYDTGVDNDSHSSYAH